MYNVEHYFTLYMYLIFCGFVSRHCKSMESRFYKTSVVNVDRFTHSVMNYV